MDAVVCPVKDCRIPVDVVLQSSDNVLIGAHKANLDSSTDGFPSAEGTSDSKDAVDLTEGGETLTLLMPFAHKALYPDLFDLSEGQLFDLAHAAEKYVVHPAIGLCSVYIRSTCEKYPLSALAYAVRHNHPRIADLTAPMTLSKDLSTMRTKLNDLGLYAWLQYKTTYIDGINKIVYRQGPSTRMWYEPLSAFTYSTWDNYFVEVQGHIPQPSYGYFAENTGRYLLPLFQLEKPICYSHLASCPCTTALMEWKNDMVGLIGTVPAFSSYLSGTSR